MLLVRSKLLYFSFRGIGGLSRYLSLWLFFRILVEEIYFFLLKLFKLGFFSIMAADCGSFNLERLRWDEGCFFFLVYDFMISIFFSSYFNFSSRFLISCLLAGGCSGLVSIGSCIFDGLLRLPELFLLEFM